MYLYVSICICIYGYVYIYLIIYIIYIYNFATYAIISSLSTYINPFIYLYQSIYINKDEIMAYAVKLLVSNQEEIYTRDRK